jgi:hypothetical protein
VRSLFLFLPRYNNQNLGPHTLTRGQYRSRVSPIIFIGTWLEASLSTVDTSYSVYSSTALSVEPGTSRGLKAVKSTAPMHQVVVFMDLHHANHLALPKRVGRLRYQTIIPFTDGLLLYKAVTSVKALLLFIWASLRVAVSSAAYMPRNLVAKFSKAHLYVMNKCLQGAYD